MSGFIAPAFIGPRPACKWCGGTAAMLRLHAGGLEGHNLCMVRAKNGHPIERLGDECPDCCGSGCHPKSMYGPINPSQRAIDAWAPKCKTCNGSGAVQP